MGGPLSVILADIHIVRTENGVVKPMNSPFYNNLLTKYRAKEASFKKIYCLKL